MQCDGAHLCIHITSRNGVLTGTDTISSYCINSSFLTFCIIQIAPFTNLLQPDNMAEDQRIPIPCRFFRTPPSSRRQTISRNLYVVIEAEDTDVHNKPSSAVREVMALLLLIKGTMWPNYKACVITNMNKNTP